MELQIDDVKHLANLSALEFDDKELDSFVGEFNNILKFVDQVKNADADGEIEYAPIDVEELRDDIAVESYSQEKILLNAPKQKMGCFAVPLMME